MPGFDPQVAGNAIISLPTAVGAGAGVTMTAGAAGVAGAYAQVDDGTNVPAGPFTIVGCGLDTPSAGMIGSIDLAAGAGAAEVIFANIPLSEIATDAGGYSYINVPRCGSIAGGTRIAARLTTVAGAETLNIKMSVTAL